MVPRADFRASHFDTLIRQKGFRVIWQQGMFCACANPDSGQPDYNCGSCKGKGYVYFGDTPTRVLVASISGRKEQDTIGLDDIGGAYLTSLSTDNVGFRDRFVFQDFTMKYSEIVKFSGGVDALRYPALDIIAVRRLDTEYRRGIDFELSKDGKSLEWKNSTAMYDNQTYSVLYDTRPVYIAINPIHEMRGTYTLHKGRGEELFVVLPKQFQIRREDFIESDRSY